MSQAQRQATVIGPRQVWNAWIRAFGTERCSAAMDRRPVGHAARDRNSLFWALRHCCDYQPSLPDLSRLTGFAHSVVARCVAKFEEETTNEERAALWNKLRQSVGGAP